MIAGGFGIFLILEVSAQHLQFCYLHVQVHLFPDARVACTQSLDFCVTCNEQARKGSKGCTKECKLYELQEPGMTCRDSVLLHAEEAKKILKIRSHNS